MDRSELLPQARVVRAGGHVVTPPRTPRSSDEPGVLRARAGEVFGLMIGMWPLTATMLLMAGLLIMAANGGGMR